MPVDNAWCYVRITSLLTSLSLHISSETGIHSDNYSPCCKFCVHSLKRVEMRNLKDWCNVYWTVYHRNSWRIKDQLDVTCYILFHFLCARHDSDINISIIRSLRLCCWITTSVVLFCKDGLFSVSVNLPGLVICVWCDVLCRFVVVGRLISIDMDRYFLCFVIIVFACV